MKYISVAEMRAIEEQAHANGLTYPQMMENAGSGLADVIAQLADEHGFAPVVLGLVGPGNNGGDTLIALTLLAEMGWQAQAYTIGRTGEGDALLERLEKAGGEVIIAEKHNRAKLQTLVESTQLILDGLLGTGIKLPLRSEMSAVLKAVQSTIKKVEYAPFILAVDCPSGVDCDSGAVAEEALKANLTVCMAAVKHGLLKFPAYQYVGDLHLVDIGLPEKLPLWKAVKQTVATHENVESLLPARPADVHKGTFGTALIVAGSVTYTGAALLAGEAAYRAGAGLVTLAIPAPLHAALAGQFPEATWLLLPHEMGVIAEGAADILSRNLARATALLVGPGLGLEESTRSFLGHLLKDKVTPKKQSGRIGFVQAVGSAAEAEKQTLPPLVLDADGLRLLSALKGWENLLPAETVLTPHPGEMAALTDLPKEDIQADRLSVAVKYAKKWNCIVLLKGALTVVAAPDGRATIIPVATAALAKAGTGDVLAGFVTGLRAQGLDAFEAAVAGAYIHAMAGLFAAERLGTTASVLAGDVLDALADVLMGMDI